MRVIEIINNRVTQVKQMLPHYRLQENEMYSSVGEHGQVYNPETGEFTDYVPTPEEQKQAKEQQRASELREIIKEKQFLGDDITSEQAELRAITNGTHDEYLKKVEQDAIDAYTLELIEGGLL